MRIRRTTTSIAIVAASLALGGPSAGGCDDSPLPSPPSATTGAEALHRYPPNGNTREFRLVIRDALWEVGPGAVYKAIAYNGQIPGPPIDVTAGDRVRIVLTNASDHPHSIHTHVVEFDYANDGVEGRSLVAPGETRVIEWNAAYAGTFPYHDHGHEADGVGRGLFGALIVRAPDEPPAREQLVVLSDFEQADYDRLPGVVSTDGGLPSPGEYRGGHQYMHTINGRAYEDGVPQFRARVGDRVRWRIVSIGREFHTWHVHGHRWLDPSRVLTDNIQLGPGMYATFEFIEDNPGSWLVHCHVPDHLEGGMQGRYEVGDKLP